MENRFMKEPQVSKNEISFATMQADHRDWNEARVQWRCKMQKWQQEHDAAVARLAELQKVIRAHGEALSEYSETLTEAEKTAAEHDRQMAKYESGKSQEPQDVLANRHQEQAGLFAREQEAHERIRKHHEEVMAQLRRLEAAATASM
jgi:hypothetical protein